MNRHNWMVALLTVVAFTAPAFAQSDPHAGEKWQNGTLVSAIERAAVKAVQEHRASVCPNCGQPYSVDEMYHNAAHHCTSAQEAKEICARCGKEIHDGQRCDATKGTTFCRTAYPQASTPAQEPKAANECYRCGKEVHQGQHCKATDYTALCAAEPESTNCYTSDNTPARCPTCLEPYTMEELYHCKKHTCSASAIKASKKVQYCIYCGEKIKYGGQECTATQGNCTVNCPECGQNLRDPKNLVNGEHRCKFKYRYSPVPAKKQSK